MKKATRNNPDSFYHQFSVFGFEFVFELFFVTLFECDFFFGTLGNNFCLTIIEHLVKVESDAIRRNEFLFLPTVFLRHFLALVSSSSDFECSLLYKASMPFLINASHCETGPACKKMSIINKRTAIS